VPVWFYHHGSISRFVGDPSWLCISLVVGLCGRKSWLCPCAADVTDVPFVALGLLPALSDARDRCAMGLLCLMTPSVRRTRVPLLT
jgi:hypothetical protein